MSSMPFLFILLSIINVTWLNINDNRTLSENGPRHAEYQSSLESALANNRPILLHFTADNCTNLITMKELLRSDSVKALLSNYIYLELSVTDNTPLARQEIYENKQGIRITTKGMRNADLEMSVYHENVQPYLVIINGNEEILTASTHISTSKALREFLLHGIRK